MNLTPHALRNGILTLWLLVLAGCQTTSQHTEPAARLKPPAVSSVQQHAQRKSTWRAPLRQDEPHTLWTRIRDGFQLEPALIDSPRVDQQRLHFASQARYFEITSERAQRYLHYVVEELDKRDMPL